VAVFDFTLHMRRLCEDIVARLDAFAHIEMCRVEIRFCQTRQQGQYGIQASLTPMRFEGGAVETIKRGRRYTVQPLLSGGCEVLYLLSFYLPRFLDRPFKDKLHTVIHELWHIGPMFDGDIRRHAGRCYAHSRSKKQFDEHAAALADRWLALDPPPASFDFLQLNFRQLVAKYGPVVGQRIATPRLLPAG
jgi:hypothetical protein